MSEAAEQCEEPWGHILIVDHSGPPAEQLQEILRREVAGAADVEVHCTLAGYDVIIIPTTGEAHTAARAALIRGYTSKHDDENGWPRQRHAPTEIVREIKLGPPIDLGPIVAPDAMPKSRNVAHIHVAVEGDVADRAKVHQARHVLVKKMRPRILSANETLGENGLFVKVAYNRIEEIFHILGHILPEIPGYVRSKTFVTIRLRHRTDGDGLTWEQRLQKYFDERPGRRVRTSELVEYFGVEHKCFARGLKALCSAHYLERRKVGRTMVWWRPKPNEER